MLFRSDRAEPAAGFGCLKMENCASFLLCLIFLISASARCVGFSWSPAGIQLSCRPRSQGDIVLRQKAFCQVSTYCQVSLSISQSPWNSLRGSLHRKSLSVLSMSASNTGTTVLEDGTSVTGTDEQRQRTKVWNVIEVSRFCLCLLV